MCGIKWGLGAQVLISHLLSDETFFLNGAFFLHVNVFDGGFHFFFKNINNTFLNATLMTKQRNAYTENY